MVIRIRLVRGLAAGAFVLACLTGAPAAAQDAAVVRGRVTFDATGDPVHGALVLVVGANRSATTDDRGAFEIRNVPPGTYEVLAQRDRFTTSRQRITVGTAPPAELVFALALLPVQEQVTVTANPSGDLTTFEAFNAIDSVDSVDIARRAAPSLAAVVQQTPGVDVRSFGPGSERPIIRGFDGDRVLILEDGVRTGDLSSQSADHGTTVDPGGLDRVEVVRGPATLLYGSNAIGGVVHALTPQETFRRAPFNGVHGQILTDAGSGNGQAGLNANVQYGQGGWTLWAGGGSRRSSDYHTPDGVVENSASRLANGRAGAGYSGARAFFSVGYGHERGRYGVPFAGEFHAHDDEHEHGEEEEEEGEEHEEGEEEHHELFVDLEPRRHSLRFDAGLRDLRSRLAESVRVVVSRLDWRHDELEIEEGVESIGTRFENTTTAVRAEVEQPRTGNLSGRFGVSTEFRSYAATGEEALAPETSQRSIGVFAYEQLDFGRTRIMFGGRFDRTSYDTVEREGPDHPPGGGHVHDEEGIVPPSARDRSFTGGSGSVGVHVEVAPRTAIVATLTRSYRAPALEELYNFGPHAGNLAFEIGNTSLEREASLGADVSLRHRSARARGEINAFYYGIDDFVFASIDPAEQEHGLSVAEYLQDGARFAGFDGEVGIGLHDHLWVHAGAGYVTARLTSLGEYAPRIPPLRVRVSLDVPIGGFTASPEIVWAARQDRLFRNETPTDGYTLVNVNASYIAARSHYAHVFSVAGANLTNERYRRHTSFIKDLAPEIGRSARFSYSIRFF